MPRNKEKPKRRFIPSFGSRYFIFIMFPLLSMFCLFFRFNNKLSPPRRHKCPRNLRMVAPTPNRSRCRPLEATKRAVEGDEEGELALETRMRVSNPCFFFFLLIYRLFRHRQHFTLMGFILFYFIFIYLTIQ